MDEAQLAAQHLEDPDDIRRVLRALQLNRSLLNITQRGTRQLASSLVLDLTPDQQGLLIDQLSDGEFQASLTPGLPLLLRAAYGGIQVSAEVQVRQILRTDGNVINELALPKKMLHRQRRAAFRAELAAADQPAISLTGDKRPEGIEGNITDVSADGLGIEFESFVRPPIEPGEIFSHCHFMLADQHWQLALTAKHPQYDRQTDKYRCGFSFFHLKPAQAKRINQWVLQIQRQQRVASPMRRTYTTREV